MMTMQNKTFTTITSIFVIILMIGSCSFFFGPSSSSTEKNPNTCTATGGSASSSINQSNFTVSPSMVPTTLSYSKQQSVGVKTDQEPVVIPTTVPVTQTNITFTNISVKPSILQVETYSLDPEYNPSPLYGLYLFQQFKVPGNCYVNWASVFIEYLKVGSGKLENWSMSIFNSTFSTVTGIVMPDAEIVPTRTIFNGTDEAKPSPFNYLGHWENVTLPHVLLNSSKTAFNQGYFIYFLAVKLPPFVNGVPIWYFCPNNQGLGVNAGNAFLCTGNFSGPGTVRLYPAELGGIHFTLILKFSPPSAFSKPADIGLQVNNQPVSTTGNGTGTFSTNDVYDPVNNQVVDNITSAWSDEFPGSLQYKAATFNVVTKNNFIPSINAIQNATAITWNVLYSIQDASLAGKALTIDSTLPLSWTHWQVYNVTKGSTKISTVTVTRAPAGNAMLLDAKGLSTGKFLLVAVAPIIPLAVSFTMAGHQLNVYQDLQGQVLVVHGPNGEAMMLRSDYEGGISNVATIVGLQGPGATSNLAKLDGISIRFTNDSKGPFIHPGGPITFKSYINTSFDLFVNPPQGFLASSIRDMELVLDYASFNKSWWIANFTGGTMPDNPLHWNIDSFTPADWYLLLAYDTNVMHINFTYNSTYHRYSDFYFNVSATVYNETLLPLNTIKTMQFTLVSSFNYSNDNVALFIKNQALKKFVQLNSTTKRLGYDNESVVTWNNANEVGISNISQYILNDGKNTVQVMFRPTNKTYNINRLAKSHIFEVNVALLNFTYTNAMKNFSLQVYNQTSGKKLSPIAFSPGVGPSEARFNLTSLATNIGNLFNSTTNGTRIFINATGIAPFDNTIYFDVDRIMLNITYKGISRQTWNQSVYNAAGGLRIAMSNTTLFNSPSNNMTMHVPFNAIIDFYNNYTYKVIWSNETDLSMASYNFTINRFASTITSSGVSTSTSVLAGSSYGVQAKLIYTGNGTTISNKLLAFDFKVLYRNGTRGDVIETAGTNATGSALTKLATVDSMRSFTYAVNFTDTNPVFMPASIAVNKNVTVLNLLEYAAINGIASTLTSTSITTGTSVLAGSVYTVQANLVYTGNGTAIEGKLLTFHFIVMYRNGTRGDVIETSTTDAAGNALAQLTTADSMQSFTYSVNFTDTNPFFKHASIMINQTVNVLNTLEYMESIIVNYAFIIFPAIGAVIVIGIVKRSSDVRKKRRWSADAATIRDVIKIQHLLVIAKSGVCLVNRSYSQMQLDGDLISGFLNAISTFGKEVGGKGTSAKAGEGVVFDYQDFKILLQEGRFSQVAIILNGVPSDNLRLRAKAFIDGFEQAYDLQNWRGNLDYFEGVDNYIEKAFEITLIYPLIVNQRKSKKEIKTGLGKALFEVGEAVQKEKQTFYLSTLLNYAQAGRKESQDHVLAEIYRLKREGFFTFYSPQASTAAI